MPVDHIRYDLLTQDALRGVIRTVLADAAVKGLPGEHHFFITFDTRADGVRLSARLRASYPGEMTIVLQHQFWDLVVGDDDFEVGLAFNGIPERLHIPIKAVRAFMDPAVQFGLQFTVDVEAAGEAAPAPAETPVAAMKLEAVEKPSPAKQAPAVKSSKQPSKKEPRLRTVATDTANSGPAPVSDKSKSDKSKSDKSKSDKEGTGEVVRLDRFRKK